MHLDRIDVPSPRQRLYMGTAHLMDRNNRHETQQLAASGFGHVNAMQEMSLCAHTSTVEGG